ncbi:hypothetical protein EVB68_027 [Rhizobium phage RHph_Y2_6]|uniref:Uncharacterized protein n=1 Tax=Rhizobium phage RHph_Y2_6 TaxID=2509576 RepID=A0A7S5RAG4_9CAUD|nr:hypothetical protein PP748_gp027 [Rhizobium phage RHph_Y2_6]QIG68764.1 hypothetical protein EVB68_027 [Rhizobium phage RHph_Y2_6]
MSDKAIVHEVYIVWQIMWKLVRPQGMNEYVQVDDPKELWDIYTTQELAEEEAARAKADDEEGGLMFSRYEVQAHTVKDEIGE